MSAQESPAAYRIQPTASRFTVKAFAAGLLAAMGHNPTFAIRDYSGEAGFTGDELAHPYLRITARAQSLEDTDDVSQKDKQDIEARLKEQVLEAARFADIAFESASVTPSKVGENLYGVNIIGNLTLHGFTRSETIRAQLSLSGDSFRAFGEFSLRQTDYGIKLVSVAGGSLKVKDEVKVSFDIVARKQE